MSRFRTLSDFGGPSVPAGYRTGLTDLIARMQDVPLAYEMDVMLYVGGDFLEITDPTGLYVPRVSPAKKAARFTVQMNNEDVMAAGDPQAFLRATFHQAMSDVFDRIAAKDSTFDAAAEKAKIAFLADA